MTASLLSSSRGPAWRAAGLALLALGTLGSARAEEKFVYMTNWFAEAEHGGFYQAVATGLYKKAGLDVTIKMGGPQVNIFQLMAAGQADCVMGSSDLQIMQTRENGLPITTVAAMMQKDPQVLIAHEDVKTFEQLKGKTILIAASANQGYWPWVKSKFGLTDSQTRPYTFNIQPFVADKNTVQQGYITSEPYAIQKAGVKASAEGWKSYLADPAPGNALIKKDNPEMTDDQLAYSVAKLKESGMVTGGDAAKLGIGIITPARAQASYDFMVSSKLLDPNKVKLADTYTADFVKDLKVLP